MAGDYGNEHVVVSNSGTATDPIVFQGVDGTPTIQGDDTGIGIYVNGTYTPKQYITIKNISVSNYKTGIYFSHTNNMTTDNCIVKDIGFGGNNGQGIFYWFTDNSIISNCTLTDAGTMVGIEIRQSNNNLVDNCKIYQTIPASTGNSNDYSMMIGYGHDNIIQNSLAQNNTGELIGHGIGIKDNPIGGTNYYDAHSYNNKIINSTANGYGESFFIAHHAYNNEISNCYSDRANIPGEHWWSCQVPISLDKRSKASFLI